MSFEDWLDAVSEIIDLDEDRMRDYESLYRGGASPREAADIILGGGMP